ncbi:BREX-1 system adenine-specific DNA-methyltransferase PglX [Actinotignum timonense]|uniref:BREX-1 system adenine-specific DNA-methyltransferase PglX n=1 Tax=Actinotignum timonense TaxID=1870995 RepID=UPI00254C6ED9|nr:BREX-1 system adenine-specific DNA-methyltransferase PglX [Actinotignum timonense]MDK6927468.1 BREX-1 system adenine-specific DNA-methyltransferase PglX [Actinotignum timonense]
METAPLKNLATWARKELIAQVDSRISAILAPTSPHRAESKKAVEATESDIASLGRDTVIEHVAYTWFNRIVALRFMDANGYTRAGVVSPALNQPGGQPEILADAKQLSFDPDIVPPATIARVTGLLDGSILSSDPQNEAYALLLAAYCRYWHTYMPFMFETAGDYTELLIPSNLLAADSILSRMVTTLSPDVCQDVEVIGWLYQFYISERKDEVFAGFKANKKAGAAEIPAATQLFTPHWIVRYLVENSVGRLWMLNHPDSNLAERMDYYIAPDTPETDFLRISTPEELTVIDPACGSAHMLTYAFDLLYAIYEEEGYPPAEIPSLILEHNLFGVDIDKRAADLAAFALTMKARARQRTFFKHKVHPNICNLEKISFDDAELATISQSGEVLDKHEVTFWQTFSQADIFGSLLQPDAGLLEHAAARISVLHKKQQSSGTATDLFAQQILTKADRVIEQATYLARKYAVVVANPPYMGSRSMCTELSSFAKKYYPDSKSDLFAMFIERCSALTIPSNGLSAMVTMQSWMFLSSFEKLRNKVLCNHPPISMAHLGARAFDSISGEVVSATAFVLEAERKATLPAVYVRLIDGSNESIKAKYLRGAVNTLPGKSSVRRFTVPASTFRKLPGSVIAYWLSPKMVDMFEIYPALSTRSRSAKGMVTADNDTFVRYWWEISFKLIGFNFNDRKSALESTCKWFPYAKGGNFRKWAGNLETVVNWQNDGYALQNTLTADRTRVRATNFNLDRIFREGIAWTVITSGQQSFRMVPQGCLFDAAAGLCQSNSNLSHLSLLNSSVADMILDALNPTINLHPGYLGKVPLPTVPNNEHQYDVTKYLIRTSESDWDSYETSWDFKRPEALDTPGTTLAERFRSLSDAYKENARDQQSREIENNRIIAEACGLQDEVPIQVPLHRISLKRNVEFRYGEGKTDTEYTKNEYEGLAKELISYAVGCMFGRYSLDVPGLLLADQGATLDDYFARVSAPTYAPDTDNVFPIVDGDWFEDDIVAKLRDFLRVAFGEKDLTENVRFLENCLGVATLRDYFVTSKGSSPFYDDHVARYQKRPIYWMFSSPKGSFNALIYMHRYTPSTAGTVLSEYLRDYQAKLEASQHNLERIAAGAGTPRQQATAPKEIERIRKILVELDAYEHDVLYPLASKQLKIDLDDGVKVNYAKFGKALRKVKGL